MTDNALTKGGALIRIKSMMCQLAASHPTDSMDEVPMVQIFKSVLVRVVGVGTTVELMSGGVFNTILVMSILEDVRTHETTRPRDLFNIPLH